MFAHFVLVLICKCFGTKKGPGSGQGHSKVKVKVQNFTVYLIIGCVCRLLLYPSICLSISMNHAVGGPSTERHSSLHEGLS